MSTMHRTDAPQPTLDQIMGAIEGCEASRDELRDLIAAALADARHEGAVAMLASVESALDDLPLPDGFFLSDIMGAINDALPLPTDQRQAAQINRLQHQADQADQIDVHGIVDALSWMGVSTPEGGTEAAAARLGRLVNDLSEAVLRHKIDHRRKREEIERLKADLSRERAAHDETRLARNRARLDGIAEARANLLPEIERLKADAAAYQLLRRGQHWSVIDGVGQTLRGEELDAAVAAVKGRT